jgi:hypothetical protein
MPEEFFLLIEIQSVYHASEKAGKLTTDPYPNDDREKNKMAAFAGM